MIVCAAPYAGIDVRGVSRSNVHLEWHRRVTAIVENMVVDIRWVCLDSF
jgi:hypothetical protein